jgi:hypothetical protein
VVEIHAMPSRHKVLALLEYPHRLLRLSQMTHACR